MKLMRSPGIRATVATAIAGAAVAGTMAATAVPASASSSTIHAVYKVTGSTFLKAPNATLPLGPGKLAANLNPATGNLKAKLTMPDATLSFNEFGLIPVTATTHFINNGPTTGTLNLTTGAVTTTSKLTFQIVSLNVAGIPIPVGPSCESSTPAVIQVSSQPGFSILKGGNLAGTYTVPQFANCGLTTALINLTLTGPGNTITLTLGKAKLG
jgi:Tfp pilus assembly protein PilW